MSPNSLAALLQDQAARHTCHSCCMSVHSMHLAFRGPCWYWPVRHTADLTLDLESEMHEYHSVFQHWQWNAWNGYAWI